MAEPKKPAEQPRKGLAGAAILSTIPGTPKRREGQR